MKTVHDMRKDGLAWQLYDRVKAGEKRTINEWAEEFDILPDAISRALTRLRKANGHLHPVGTVTDFSGKAKKGIVVDIMEREEWFTEIYDRRFRVTINPAIKDYFRKTELGLKAFPHLRQSITVAFNNLFAGFRLIHGIFRLPEPKVPKAQTQEEVLEKLELR